MDSTLEQAGPKPGDLQVAALPYLLGTYGSTALFGITCLQTFIYYRNYPSDRLRVKIMVAILLVLESFHAALNIHGMYWFLIRNPSHPGEPLKVSWSTTCSQACTALVTHIFYAHRVFVVSGRVWWLPVIIVLSVLLIMEQSAFALARAGNWFAFAGIALKLQLFTNMNASFPSIMAFLRDIAVLVTLIIYGATSLTALGIFVVEGNLYTNCLLATLNARNTFRQELVESALQLTITAAHESGSHGGANRQARGAQSATFNFAPTDGSNSTDTETRVTWKHDGGGGDDLSHIQRTPDTQAERLKSSRLLEPVGTIIILKRQGRGGRYMTCGQDQPIRRGWMAVQVEHNDEAHDPAQDKVWDKPRREKCSTATR
ncbi:hypothetical protein BDV98DRAFT_635595 [Pterulicium gracile]|uniref:Uncharacterized protein n=1 Tax=Pterulicium gracile TaxID=1884261 RepID=A0A5C3Q4I3_9AGAR|nr:hypothetical protein BDV98DRAFT_635595 [Pterula gracilis]